VYSKNPFSLKVKDQDLPGKIIPLSKYPSGCALSILGSPKKQIPLPLVTVCPTMSSFVHVTVSPISTS